MNKPLDECPHRILRKKDSSELTFTAYVCGQCATIFEVEVHVEPPPQRKEPMFPKNPVPWGLRGRQA